MLMETPSPSGRGFDDGPTDRQVVAKPPPGADIHTNPPETNPSIRGAEVAGSRRLASLHDPRAHQQRHVNANRLVVQNKPRTPPGTVSQAEGGGVS